MTIINPFARRDTRILPERTRVNSDYGLLRRDDPARAYRNERPAARTENRRYRCVDVLQRLCGMSAAKNTFYARGIHVRVHTRDFERFQTNFEPRTQIEQTP